ncbi:MAG: RecX family transcriptional regulator, partial [Novosphingobium sp.]|nr:RecX family transcriptional regulator [Novosphingobium sp.]
MAASSRRSPPLDSAGLEALALGHVARYATSRARLRAYLERQLRQRGWEGQGEPDLEGICTRLAEAGYV